MNQIIQIALAPAKMSGSLAQIQTKSICTDVAVSILSSTKSPSLPFNLACYWVKVQVGIRVKV